MQIDNANSESLPVKSDELWTIQCYLESDQVTAGRWQTQQWRFDSMKLTPSNDAAYVADLILYRDERTDYRFNLSSGQPKLFLVIDTFEQSEVGSTEKANIVTLTASQSVAGNYMDGDYLVLSQSMPLPVQAWMEAFIGKHGELIEVKKKKRKGAGRSSGQ